MKFTTIKNLMVLAALIFATGSIDAQQIGKPDGNLINFINTNAQGGLLAHRQQGTIGNFGAFDRWIGIGQPSFGGAPVPVYGIRIQDSGQSGTLSLNANNNPNNIKDYELQWGPQTGSKFRLNFIQSITNPNALRRVMTATSEGRVGINADDPDFRLQSVGEGDKFAIGAINEEGGGVFSLGQEYGYFADMFDNVPGDVYAYFTKYSRSVGGNNFGVLSVVDNQASSSYGIYTEASAVDDAFGIYAAASAGATAFAGFFDGDIDVTGNIFNSSDRKLKENIADEIDAMDRIMSLRPATYNYLQTGQPGQLNLPEGDQHGFIAQELEEVFPELVTEAKARLRQEGETADNEMPEYESYTFKSVNYIGLIPVLTAGMQEQQRELEQKNEVIDNLTRQNVDQELRINDLESRLAALEGQTNTGKAGAAAATMQNAPASVLFQNTPNPFDAETKIRIQVAEGSQSAQLLIFDMNGRQIRSFNDLQQGENALTIQGSELEAGMYFYSLVVDGQEVDTKRMILTK